MKLTIDLSCGECGSNRLDLPALAGDHSPVICEECGHALGSLAEVKARVEQAVLRRVGTTEPPGGTRVSGRDRPAPEEGP